MVFKNSRERLADRHPEGAVPAPAGHSCPGASDSVYTQSLSHRNDVACSKLESGHTGGKRLPAQGKVLFPPSQAPRPHGRAAGQKRLCPPPSAGRCRLHQLHPPRRRRPPRRLMRHPPGPAALRTHARPGQARPGSEGHSATDVSPSAQWGQNAYPRRPLEGPEITATTAQRTSTGSCSYSRHRRPVAPATLCTCGPPGGRTELAARVREGQRQPGGRPPRHRDSAATSANGSPGSDGTRRP